MKNILEFRVLKKDKLLNFLYSNVNKSKNNIKTLLKNGCVYVNEKKVTKFDFDLNVNDNIVIKMFNTKLDILYEDKNLIIVNKKDKLLTVSNNNISENTLYKEVSSYVKKTNKNNKIFANIIVDFLVFFKYFSNINTKRTKPDIEKLSVKIKLFHVNINGHIPYIIVPNPCNIFLSVISLIHK